MWRVVCFTWCECACLSPCAGRGGAAAAAAAAMAAERPARGSRADACGRLLRTVRCCRTAAVRQQRQLLSEPGSTCRPGGPRGSAAAGADNTVSWQANLMTWRHTYCPGAGSLGRRRGRRQPAAEAAARYGTTATAGGSLRSRKRQASHALPFTGWHHTPWSETVHLSRLRTPLRAP